MISEHEIDAGLVLHLDPDELEAAGATYTSSADARVKGEHFFVCIGADDDYGLWLPLYSNPGFGRKGLDSEGRRGHPKWTQGKFHYHEGQLWTATHIAVQRAARAGGDLSSPDSRNLLTGSSFEVLADSMRERTD